MENKKRIAWLSGERLKVVKEEKGGRSGRDGGARAGEGGVE